MVFMMMGKFLGTGEAGGRLRVKQSWHFPPDGCYWPDGSIPRLNASSSFSTCFTFYYPPPPKKKEEKREREKEDVILFPPTIWF